MVPGAGIEPARLAAGDFESPASTNFTTRALGFPMEPVTAPWKREVRHYTRTLIACVLLAQHLFPFDAGSGYQLAGALRLSAHELYQIGGCSW